MNACIMKKSYFKRLWETVKNQGLKEALMLDAAETAARHPSFIPVLGIFSRVLDRPIEIRVHHFDSLYERVYFGIDAIMEVKLEYFSNIDEEEKRIDIYTANLASLPKNTRIKAVPSIDDVCRVCPELDYACHGNERVRVKPYTLSKEYVAANRAQVAFFAGLEVGSVTTIGKLVERMDKFHRERRYRAQTMSYEADKRVERLYAKAAK